MTVSDAERGPGLYELPLGVTLRAALTRFGHDAEAVRGALMGGFFAGLLNERVLDLPLTYDGLREQGSGLGCGAVVLLGRDHCPVGLAAVVMRYFAVANSRQCGACFNGTDAMAGVLERLAAGEATAEQLERLERWSATLPGRGGCALLDGAAGLAASLLREFPTEIERHRTAPCPRCARADHRALAFQTGESAPDGHERRER